MVVNTERRKIVQGLRKFAGEYGVDQVLDTAGKTRVQTMVQATLEAPTLTEDDRKSITDLSAKYDATWATAAEAGPAGATPAQQTNTSKEWKFHTAQLTHNSTVGEWASKDKGVLHRLFLRFCVFAYHFGTALSAEHMSVAGGG